MSEISSQRAPLRDEASPQREPSSSELPPRREHSERTMPLQLEPPFDVPAFAEALRPAFHKGAPRCLSLPGALSRASIRSLRQLALPCLRPFELADRGRYRFVDLGAARASDHVAVNAAEQPDFLMSNEGESPLEIAVRPLLDALRGYAESVTGHQLLEGRARFLVLTRGGYSLRLDDARSRNFTRAIEASLDLSSAPGNGPATVYSKGAWSHVAVAQEPGQLTLVERGPDSFRCDRYRSSLYAPRALVLLRAAFPLAES